MKVLVTGATGKWARAVAAELVQRGAAVRGLVRKQPKDGLLSKGVEIAIGDLLDPVSVEKALIGVDKLFLLNGVVADELTQALIAYGLAKRSGIKHITYLSVFRVGAVPRRSSLRVQAGRRGSVERVRGPVHHSAAGCFMQNDAVLKVPLTGPGVYPTPIGQQGIAAVDLRDIAAATAISLTEQGHEGKTYDLVGPELLSGPKAAAVWSKLLGKEDELPLDPGLAEIPLTWKRRLGAERQAQNGISTPLVGLDLVFPSTATGRHFHAAPAQQDYIRPAGCSLVKCPKCGAGVGVWCVEAGKTSNGKRLPLHDERWDAAGKDGSVGWHTFRHTYRSWLDSTSAPIGAAETYAARAGFDHDERVRKRLDDGQA